MSVHTQGPWHVDRGTNGVVLTADGRVVASVSGSHDQTTFADASLIAAAPELLAALEGLVAKLQDAEMIVGLEALDAIAKARGQ